MAKVRDQSEYPEEDLICKFEIGSIRFCPESCSFNGYLIHQCHLIHDMLVEECPCLVLLSAVTRQRARTKPSWIEMILTAV